MRHEHENARRHAYNTLAEVNRHLDRGHIKNPRHHHMLTDMAEKATRTIHNLDALEDADRRTKIGFDARRSWPAADDFEDDFYEDVEARRGRGRRRDRRGRYVKSDIREDRYDDRMDDRHDDRHEDDRMDDRRMDDHRPGPDIARR